MLVMKSTQIFPPAGKVLHSCPFMPQMWWQSLTPSWDLTPPWLAQTNSTELVPYIHSTTLRPKALALLTPQDHALLHRFRSLKTDTTPRMISPRMRLSRSLPLKWESSSNLDKLWGWCLASLMLISTSMMRLNRIALRSTKQLWTGLFPNQTKE